MTKNKNIPQWQKSVFDNSVDKTSCVKTKPISTSMIKKIDKDFFDQNYHTIKIKDPKLFEEYKKEFGIKNKSKITKNDINNNIKKIDDKENIKKIVVRDEADEKLLDTKIIEAINLTNKDQSSSLNQTNSDDELKEYIEQKKLERKIEIEQLRKEQEEPKIKFETVKKDLNCGMGFVNPFKSINQNSLGHSQSWRFKKQKKYNYYD
jgi:hypothetical protein